MSSICANADTVSECGCEVRRSPSTENGTIPGERQRMAVWRSPCESSASIDRYVSSDFGSETVMVLSLGGADGPCKRVSPPGNVDRASQRPRMVTVRWSGCSVPARPVRGNQPPEAV